jgi:hypothetical protein
MSLLDDGSSVRYMYLGRPWVESNEARFWIGCWYRMVRVDLYCMYLIGVAYSTRCRVASYGSCTRPHARRVFNLMTPEKARQAQNSEHDAFAFSFLSPHLIPYATFSLTLFELFGLVHIHLAGTREYSTGTRWSSTLSHSIHH